MHYSTAAPLPLTDDEAKEVRAAYAEPHGLGFIEHNKRMGELFSKDAQGYRDAAGSGKAAREAWWAKYSPGGDR